MVTNLEKWLKDTAWDKLYWSDIETKSIELDSDGCSGVPDIFVWSCMEHDCHYRTHRFLWGEEITKEQADYIFRVRIQQCHMSLLKWPISWIRWLGLKYLPAAQTAWDNGNS